MKIIEIEPRIRSTGFVATISFISVFIAGRFALVLVLLLVLSPGFGPVLVALHSVRHGGGRWIINLRCPLHMQLHL